MKVVAVGGAYRYLYLITYSLLVGRGTGTYSSLVGKVCMVLWYYGRMYVIKPGYLLKNYEYS